MNALLDIVTKLLKNVIKLIIFYGLFLMNIASTLVLAGFINELTKPNTIYKTKANKKYMLNL